MRIDGNMKNRYYQVVTPFDVEVRVGVAEAHVWVGRLQALQDLYQTVTVRPGDEMHLLVGGDFLIRRGVSYAFDTRRHQAQEVMLHPAPFDPALPMDRLAEITREEAQRPAAYRPHDFTVGAAPILVSA